MKNTWIALTTAISLLFTTLPLFALAEEETTTEPAETTVTTETTVAATIETLPQNGQYNGYFRRVRIDGTSYDDPRTELYVGETLDLSEWELIPCYLTPDKEEKMVYNENLLYETAEYPEHLGIPADAEEYTHCFTIDASEVDTSKPGYYWVHIRTIPGETVVFHDRYDPDFSYEITMREYDIRVYVVVSERPEPSVSLTLRNSVIMDNGETNVIFGGNATADLTGSKLTAEPEGIVEIGELAMPPLGYYQMPQATIKALKPGTVTITGTTDSGLTATCTLVVRDHTHYLDGTTGYAGTTEGVVFYSESDQTAEFTIADDSIAKIVNIEEMGNFSEHTQYIQIELLNPGTTTLTAVTPDGRTETADITVLSAETTAIASNHTTTTTTTATETTAMTEDTDSTSTTTTTEETEPTEPTTEYWEKYNLAIISKPTKLVYHIGESLDLTGGMAAASYANSEGVVGDISNGDPLTAEVFSIDTDFDSSKPGTYTVYVTAAEGKAKDSFTVEVLPDDTTEPIEGTKLGDINGDGNIDIMDVICLNKNLLGVQSLSEEARGNADVNHDGKVDSSDSLLILKYTVELIDSFDA